jgi:hypothetical protein
VGTNGSPVPFANVQITDKNAGTYSDAKGNFSFQATDSLLKVEIKSIGYNTGNVVLRSDPAQNKIVLKENNVGYKGKGIRRSSCNRVWHTTKIKNSSRHHNQCSPC